MSDDPHVRVERYVDAAKLTAGRSELAARVHSHLLERCGVCAEEWSALAALRSTYLSRLRELRSPAGEETAPFDLSIDENDFDSDSAATGEMRRVRNKMLYQKAALLRTPADRRVEKIRRARKQFRSLMLAEMLIEESRGRVRTSPDTAAEIASLVPHVLGWTLKPGGPPAGATLIARAAAHEANALRVSGDLAASERAFIALRANLVQQPLDEVKVVAEIASLEASLRIDQRRYDEAAPLLARAADVYRYSDDQLGVARTMIKQANLQQATSQPEAALPLLNTAAAAIDRSAQPYLFLCTVTARVNALCDLDRFDEARRLLVEHLDDYEASDDAHAGALYRALLGRCALGQGHNDEAEALLTAGRDGLLAVGRAFDAALASLDLAQALLAAGKTKRLRTLAAQLVPVFSQRGIVGEALASLKLLSAAVATENLSHESLTRLRGRLIRAASPHQSR